MKKKFYTGINIQYPYSQLILNGKKTVETRTYPLPLKYLKKDLLLVETPGKKGKFKSRVVAIIQFSNCKKYDTIKKFRADYKFHKVSKGSEWDWTPEKNKWGWDLKIIKIFSNPQLLNKRNGIKFTNNICLDFN